PYDRLIATCSATSLPPAWVQQTRPGGLILVNILRGCEGGLARVEVCADGSAAGRFLADSAYFMPMRGHGWEPPPLPELRQRVQQQGCQRPVTLPQRIADERFWFLVQLALPGVERVWLPRVVRPDEPVPSRTLFESPCLVDLTDGSWARTETTGRRGSVTQGGPRRLWDEIEALYDQCVAFGFPERDRYGLTLTPDGTQRVWLDNPDSGCHWNLLSLGARVIRVLESRRPRPNSGALLPGRGAVARTAIRPSRRGPVDVAEVVVRVGGPLGRRRGRARRGFGGPGGPPSPPPFARFVFVTLPPNRRRGENTT
ncbi:MAG: hypothetical protein ACRD0K_25560, partial [Egibacteraceae bacterium]